MLWVHLVILRIAVWGSIALLATAALTYALRRPVLRAVGAFLVVADEPAAADAIVVLSGSIPDRMLEAVDLYQAHLAPRIILTQEGPLPGLAALRARGGNLPEHHELNLSIAEQLGVPRSAVTVINTPAWSTLTEAQAIVDYLRAQGISSILLVTSKTHARRARMTYRQLAGDSIRIRMCPSRYDPFPVESWWERRPYIRHVVIEYLKLLNYLLIDRWKVR